MYNDIEFQAYVLRQDEQGVRGGMENLSLEQCLKVTLLCGCYTAGLTIKTGWPAYRKGKLSAGTRLFRH